MEDRPEQRERRTLTPAVIAATLFAAACATFAVSFVAARGGLVLPIAATPPPVAVATQEPTEPPVPTSTPAPLSTPEPTAAPTETPIPTVEPTPVPTEKPFAIPSLRPNDPLRSLAPCPNHPACRLYVVQRGDTMNKILGRYDLDLAVILALNPQIKDPTVIVVGHTMYLGRDRFARLDPCPNGERCFLYRVAQGDSVKDIAARYAITAQSIRDANPGMPSPITPGLVLKLPYPG